MTTVVHRDKPHDVYIGRPSIWGNPFKIGRDGTRRQVIDKYREWVTSQEKLMEDVWKLRGKVLGCWCKPRACHGDVLAELADATLRELMHPDGQILEVVDGLHWRLDGNILLDPESGLFYANYDGDWTVGLRTVDEAVRSFRACQDMWK